MGRISTSIKHEVNIEFQSERNDVRENSRIIEWIYLLCISLIFMVYDQFKLVVAVILC